jgi:hypothetical protein
VIRKALLSVMVFASGHVLSWLGPREHGQGDPQRPQALRAGLHRRIDLVPRVMGVRAHPVRQPSQQARTVPVVVVAVVVGAGVVPVISAVMVVVMAAGSGQRIAHASQHASDRALQHINT